MAEGAVKENRMGTGSIWKLLLVIGVPSIVSLAVNSLYNIIDTLFVSRMSPSAGVSTAALTALGYAFPVQMIMVGIAVGVGVGANAAISRALGEGNKEKADRISGNSLFIGLVIYAVFLIFGATPLVDLYVRIYRSADANVINYTVTYLRICCCLSVFHIYFCLYEKILQATGKSFLNMISLVTGCAINIALDPVFISVLDLGIMGAAVATVLGQAISFGLNLTFHLRFNREIGNSLKFWKPSGEIQREIFRVGFSAIVSQILLSLMTIIMGVFLTKVDNAFFWVEENETYAASYSSAYSTFYKVQQFAFMLVFGLRSAVISITSYNHGRGYKKRVKETLGFGFLYGLVLMVVCVIIVETAARPLVGLFADGFAEGYDSLGAYVSTLDICEKAAKIIGISFLFAGANILFESVFQALDSGGYSLIVSLCRQAVFLIPIVAVATSLMVKRGSRDLEWLIWASFSISEAATVVIAAFLFWRTYRKKVLSMEERESFPREVFEDAENS
ncbi:MAG: MATE family efflux transporter [Clostridia bacterium]|nr:MATE family efflux transporter [Clostridia bacterium]